PRRATSPKVAPRAANSRASAAPIPLEAPVMNTFMASASTERDGAIRLEIEPRPGHPGWGVSGRGTGCGEARSARPSPRHGEGRNASGTAPGPPPAHPPARMPRPLTLFFLPLAPGPADQVFHHLEATGARMAAH